MRDLSIWNDLQRDEAPQTVMLRASTHTARKAHECDCCKRPILPGERYRCDVILSDGELQQGRRHVRNCWEDA